MALRIEKAFGVKMETLLNMQAWHDAYAMRQREGEIAVKPCRRLPPSRAEWVYVSFTSPRPRCRPYKIGEIGRSRR
jgi:hypothetical protein